MYLACLRQARTAVADLQNNVHRVHLVGVFDTNGSRSNFHRLLL